MKTREGGEMHNLKRTDVKPQLWQHTDPQKIFTDIDKFEKEYGLLKQRTDNPKLTTVIDQFTQTKLNIFIFSSNQIEGSKWSQGDTLKLINESKDLSDNLICKQMENEPIAKRSDPPSKREVLQHFVACRYLCENPKPLTIEMILQTHKYVATGLLDDDARYIHAGQYRTENITAQEHVFPPPDYVPAMMKDMVATYNILEADERVDTSLLAMWLMCQFVTIHPFDDVNGRMCRLLYNYALRRRQFPFYVSVALGGKQRKHYMQIIKHFQREQEDSVSLPMLWAFSSECVFECWSNFFGLF